MAACGLPQEGLGSGALVIESLLKRKIEKRPDKVPLPGRILFLTEDPELIRRQLAGEDLPWDTRNPEKNPKLRDDISTDEITPAHICFFFDETLGEFPYTGLKCGAETPIQRGDVKKGGFVAAVSGKRRGKGSSREQSPYAERSAGIKIVIAENIERIYKQNCQNRTDLRFSHEYVTPMAAIFFDQLVGRDAPVNDASTVLFFRDHLTFLDDVLSEQKRKMGLLDLATQLKLKQEDFARQRGIRLHGELKDRKGSEGICHSVVLESYALPGQLIVGSDSHTPHSGAIGCVAFGIGTTDVFNSWITKDIRVRVPESVKVVIRGRKHPNVTAKDFILALLRMDYIKSGKALAKVIEYSGEAIEELSVDERATMTNMAAEIGGFTGIVAPDKKAVEFLVERRGMNREKAEAMLGGLYSDSEAQFAYVIEMDAADITPMVATPGDPGNGKFIRELNTPVPVELAYGGTCTAGKNEDMDMYALVLADALKQGKQVAGSVQFYIQFGSQETRDYCVRNGYLEIFEKAGAHVIEPSCGACINAGPGVSTRADQIVISAQNRNFPGRSGPGQMYLASPLTVAASAVAGYIVEYQPSEQRELMPA